MNRFSAIAASIFAFPGCCAETSVRVHSLLSDPIAYSREAFELDTCVESSRHGIYLRDCNSREEGVDFVFAEGVYKQSESIEFMRAARRGWSPTYKGVLSIKLVGKMEQKDSEWVLFIYKVNSFVEAPRQASPPQTNPE